MKRQPKNLRRQPQQQRSQQRVEQILEAAAVVFDEVGFEAATTHAIAARANTAVGSLYQFFPNKLAIFNALELQHIDRVYVMWERLSRPEIVQLPFTDFVHTLVTQVQQLFEHPVSRTVFVQFFTAPNIFKNIDRSFTQEAIKFVARLFMARNRELSWDRSQILAEICVNASNTLILLSLRSEPAHGKLIVSEIETLLGAYLQIDLGDEVTDRVPTLNKAVVARDLTSRQRLILNYAANNREFTIKNCEAMLPNVSRRTLQRDLKALCDRQILRSQGSTDRRSYRLNPDFMN